MTTLLDMLARGGTRGDGRFYLRREIGIDAGHRVTNHGSKCRNFHGHRYTIQALYSGLIADADGAENEGMAGGLDFGFVKQHMVDEIDKRCDHAMILWIKDPMLRTFIGDDAYALLARGGEFEDGARCHSPDMGAVYVVDDVPTAENLARHWYVRLVGALARHVDANPDLARWAPRLDAIGVYETPNNMVLYYS